MAFNREKFIWRGLSLRWGKTPLLTLVADETYPHLYRINYPDGWKSAPANLTRAKDAAYDHGRYLLGRRSHVEAAHSPESIGWHQSEPKTISASCERGAA